MPRSNVARRYAQGAFQLAREQGNLDGWRAELATLEALLDDDVLKSAFNNPAVNMVRRMELARRLAPDLTPGSENLLRLLIEHQRTSEMPAIRREFDRLADQASGVLNVTLTTAGDVATEDRERYAHQLGSRLGRQVRVEYARDPALIGGAKIQIGDRVVDGSLRTQLQRLRQQLTG
ncbi:MAG TPA: F0F1 ATP synthase subunit delta [Candidatus Limnocylindrales bacterium]|nr:F0F1 ATP synthase subunit delta [Candidatus Limnocylindrales bacterium]